MPTWWIFAVAAAFILSVIFTDLMILITKKFDIVDHPNKERKKHKKAVPLMGGTAIFFAFSIVTIVVMATTDHFTSGDIDDIHLIGFLLGGLVLIVGGFFDDKFELPPKLSIIFPILAALFAVIVGIGPSKITNPLGGAFDIPEVVSSIFTFLWIMCLIYTTKLLDGLDGLATGISAIGTLMIALLALATVYYQPDVALMALIAFAALLGFLLWNFNPAQIFLGDGGSTYVGYLIGMLAIISGSKIATALLVVGIPALDVLFVIIERYKNRKAISTGDRLHLHHKLFDLGLNQRQIVAFYYIIAISFGLTTIIFESWQKLLALGFLFIIMLTLAIFISKAKKYEA